MTNKRQRCFQDCQQEGKALSVGAAFVSNEGRSEESKRKREDGKSSNISGDLLTELWESSRYKSEI